MGYEKLRTVQNRFEAELLSAALERSGIDFFLRTFEDTAYDGLFVTQEGWGVFWVESEDLQLRKIYCKNLTKPMPKLMRRSLNRNRIIPILLDELSMNKYKKISLMQGKVVVGRYCPP